MKFNNKIQTPYADFFLRKEQPFAISKRKFTHTLGERNLATTGLAEHLRAATAHNDGLSVAEDSGDVGATRALNILTN